MAVGDITCESCGSRYWCHNEDLCHGEGAEAAEQRMSDIIALEYMEIKEGTRSAVETKREDIQ